MNKSNYIEQALRTESIEGAQDRLVKCFTALKDLSEDLAVYVEGDADDLKKYIYYGKQPSSVFFSIDTDTYHLFKHANVSNENIRLLHAGLGLLTEAEEFLQPVLKSILEGVDLDKTNLKEELGDSQWYGAIACDALGTTFEAEQERNIAKLTARYPEKFTEDKAINRDLATERGILESGNESV